MNTLPQAPTRAELKSVAHPPHRFHSVEKKRRIVEETFRPHASAARLQLMAKGPNKV